MRKFYLSFPNSETQSHKLSWSHYFEILKADNPLEIGFYTKQTEKENWSVRELKRQMKSMLFHRLALSKDKEGVLVLVERGQDIEHGSEIMPFCDFIVEIGPFAGEGYLCQKRKFINL